MPLVKLPVSMLTAGVLALALACSGAGARAGNPPIESEREIGSPASSATPAGTSAAASEPAISVPFQAPRPAAAAVDTGPAAFGAAGTPARKSPMQALNQMVTAQALLVSLLLAPLSKPAAKAPLARVDAPLARVDAPSVGAPTH